MVHRTLLSIPLLVHSGVRIDLHRGAQFCVPHELLNHPHIVAGMGQEFAIGPSFAQDDRAFISFITLIFPHFAARGSIPQHFLSPSKR
jgi:hypothetical protein